MGEILDFMLSHWQLSGLLLLLIISYVIFEWWAQEGGGSTQVTPEQAIELFNHHDAVLLDIRTAEQFKAGHVVGSSHVDFDESDKKLKKFGKYAQRPVIVISLDGKNAGTFASRLAQHGLTKVLSLGGGISAWQAAGLPLTKKSK